MLVREVYLAVSQLTVVHRNLLGRLAGLLLYARYGLALLLVLDDLLLQHLRRLWMLVQVVVQIHRKEITHKLLHRHPRRNLLRAKTYLRLRLEHRVVHTDRYGRYDRRADIRRIVILMIKLLDNLGYRSTEGRLMRSSLRGILSVDERIVALAISRTVCYYHLYILTRQMDRRIERLLRQVVVHQIEQAVLRDIFAAVERDLEAEVQIGVVAHHLLHEVHVVGVLAEDLLVYTEAYAGTRAFIHAALPLVRHLESLGKGHRMRLAVTHRACHKLAREHIHRLDAHTVQAHRLLERLARILAARVHLAHRRRERLERNAAAIVAHRHHIVLDGDVDTVARTHDELVDRVVDRLLYQHIYAVVGLRTVAQLADIHSRAQAQMLARRERTDRVVVIRRRRLVVIIHIDHFRFHVFHSPPIDLLNRTS